MLRTGRLILRTPHPGDAESIAALVNDRRIAENTARIPHPYTPRDAAAFIAYAQAHRGRVFLVTLPGDTLLGCCGLGTWRNDGPEIGYWLGLPYWRRGYATEAARAVLDHAFGALGLAVVLGSARVSNQASRRVLEKCGFEWTGVALQRIRALKTSVPCDRFRLDRERWNSLREQSLPYVA